MSVNNVFTCKTYVLGLSLQFKNNSKNEQIQLTVYYPETFHAEGRALTIIVIRDKQNQDLEP